MIRKILITASALAIACSSLLATETISGSDPKVSIIGRHLNEEDGSIRFNWSATTLRIQFTGKTLKMECSDSHKDYFNIWIDKAQTPYPDKIINVAGDSLVTLFNGKKGTHTIILQKRTEGEQGIFTLKSLTTDGKFNSAPEGRPRMIEFIGDSYTCGYGTEAPDKDQPFKAETENPSLTYADIIGRLFDAEAMHISHSGRGIVRNYDGFNPTENMVKLYRQTIDQVEPDTWEVSYTPDLVVIYLGTNDFSCAIHPALSWWCEGYANLLNQVRNNFGPEVPIICMASPADEMMGYYVQEAARRSGVANISCVMVDMRCYNHDSDLGASWHPNYKGHRKVASTLAPVISTVTGWDLPIKAIQ